MYLLIPVKSSSLHRSSCMSRYRAVLYDRGSRYDIKIEMLQATNVVANNSARCSCKYKIRGETFSINVLLREVYFYLQTTVQFFQEK